MGDPGGIMALAWQPRISGDGRGRPPDSYQRDGRHFPVIDIIPKSFQLDRGVLSLNIGSAYLLGIRIVLFFSVMIWRLIQGRQY
jgi:hypothetical protein